MADAQNRLATSDGINRPRPGRDLLGTIANCTRINGMCQLSGTTFLIAATVSGAAAWYSFTNNTTLTNITGLNGAPTFNTGNTVYMTQGNTAVYVVWQSLIYKWDGTNWTQITTQPAHPNYDYITWFTDRLIAVEHNSNQIDMSGFLSDSTWDTVNLSVQIDARTNDQIIAMCPYQQFNLVVFKKSATWLLDCNPSNEVLTPTPSIANFPIQMISSVIGCAEQRTVCQAGNDILFLSESGRGVFSIGQIATNEQQAIQSPLSLPVQGYINRINWSAVGRAHAVVWDGLYILAVPLDGAATPNFLLVYSIFLQSWQGIWLNYNSDTFALQTYQGVETQFIIGDQAGNVYRHWYAADQVYLDTTSGNIATGVPFLSQFTSRGYRYGETFNNVQPYTFILEFTQSTSLVNIQLFADTAQVGAVLNVAPYNSLLSLPLNLPFNLPATGNVIQTISARPCALCTEAQIQISGTGPWCVVRLSGAAWVGRSRIIQQ